MSLPASQTSDLQHFSLNEVQTKVMRERREVREKKKREREDVFH